MATTYRLSVARQAVVGRRQVTLTTHFDWMEKKDALECKALLEKAMMKPERGVSLSFVVHTEDEAL